MNYKTVSTDVQLIILMRLSLFIDLIYIGFVYYSRLW